MGLTSMERCVSGGIAVAQHVAAALEQLGVVGLLDLGEGTLQPDRALLGVLGYDHVALAGCGMLVVAGHWILLMQTSVL